MTSEPETLGDTARHLALRLKRDIDWRPGSVCEQAAATLRALAAENAALRADADAHDTPAWIANERLNLQRDNLIAERDATVTALNEALAAVTTAEQRAAKAEAALEAMTNRALAEKEERK